MMTCMTTLRRTYVEQHARLDFFGNSEIERLVSHVGNLSVQDVRYQQLLVSQTPIPPQMKIPWRPRGTAVFQTVSELASVNEVARAGN
jgi:hypothetical protein